MIRVPGCLPLVLNHPKAFPPIFRGSGGEGVFLQPCCVWGGGGGEGWSSGLATEYGKPSPKSKYHKMMLKHLIKVSRSN